MTQKTLNKFFVMQSVCTLFKKKMVCFSLYIICSTQSIAQNSMVGDGFGGRAWYHPTNYSFGSYSGFAICGNDHQLMGWGANTFGQLGNGDNTSTTTPVAALNMTDVRFFTSGYLSCAIKYDYTGWVWGVTPTNAPGPKFTFIPQQILTDVKFADASAYHAAFVKNDGTVWSVGHNGGQFGTGVHPFTNTTTPVQMNGITTAVRVACGASFTIVLLSDSSLMQTGTEGAQSTIHANNNSDLPEVVPGLAHNVIDIKANANCAYALTTNGDVYSWGYGDYYGGLGTGVNGYQFTPTKIDFGSSAHPIVAISACSDGDALYALDENGDVYGVGSAFALGYGSTQNAFTPVLIQSGCIDILCGETFGYVIKNNNSLWMTGGSGPAGYGSIFMGLPNSIFPSFTTVWTQLYPDAAPMNLCPVIPYGDICLPVKLGADTSICEGRTLLLSVPGQNEFVEWQDHSVAVQYLVQQAGDYWVSVVNGGCISEDTIHVDYTNFPLVQLGKDTSICSTQSIQLSAMNDEAGYLWQDNTTDAFYTATEPGIYWVTVNHKGCEASDTIRISKGDCNCTMFIPNAITPNGDGINDHWVVSTSVCYQDVDVFVYNRYGTNVFTQYHYKNDWMGLYKNKQLPDGTYYYIIHARKPGGNTQVFKGNITILR